MIFLFTVLLFSNNKSESIMHKKFEKNIKELNYNLTKAELKFINMNHAYSIDENKLEKILYNLDVILLKNDEIIDLTLKLVRIIYNDLNLNPNLRPFLNEYPFLNYSIFITNYNNLNSNKRTFVLDPLIGMIFVNNNKLSITKLDKQKNFSYDKKYLINLETWKIEDLKEEDE